MNNITKLLAAGTLSLAALAGCDSKRENMSSGERMDIEGTPLSAESFTRATDSRDRLAIVVKYKGKSLLCEYEGGALNNHTKECLDACALVQSEVNDTIFKYKRVRIKGTMNENKVLKIEYLEVKGYEFEFDK